MSHKFINVVNIDIAPNGVIVSDDEIKYEGESFPVAEKFINGSYGVIQIDNWNDIDDENQYRIIAGLSTRPSIDFNGFEKELSGFTKEDVKKLAKEAIQSKTDKIPVPSSLWMNEIDMYERMWVDGFKTAQSLNDKMFSLEDMRNAFLSGCHNMSDYVENESESEDYDIYEEANIFIQSLQQTSWNVEVEMEEINEEETIASNGGFSLKVPVNIQFVPKITNNSIKIVKIM